MLDKNLKDLILISKKYRVVHANLKKRALVDLLLERVPQKVLKTEINYKLKISLAKKGAYASIISLALSVLLFLISQFWLGNSSGTNILSEDELDGVYSSELIHQNPDIVEAKKELANEYHKLGNNYLFRRNYIDAFGSYCEAIRLSPGNPEYIESILKILVDLSMNKQLEKFISQNRNCDAAVAKYFYKVGLIWMALEDYQKSTHFLEIAKICLMKSKTPKSPTINTIQNYIYFGKKIQNQLKKY